MIKNFFREIKWAYQRAVHGYDETVFWGFDDYLYNTFKEPIKIFCENALEDKDFCKWNPEKTEVHKETLRLLKEADKMPVGNYYNEVNERTRFWEYFSKNIGYFWD